MAETERELLERVRRLEAVVAALVVSDAGVEPSFLAELLSLYPYPPGDDFYYLLRRLARSERTVGVRQVLAGLEQRVAAQQEELAVLGGKTERLQVDAHAVFALQSMGLDLGRVRMPRFLPVRVYLDRTDPEAVGQIAQSVDSVLRAFGLEVADDFPAEQGSWYKKWFARSKKVATHEEVQDIARKVKRGAELAGLEKQQADINKAQAECLGTLIERAKEFDNAAIQCGTALVVVTSDGSRKNVASVTLTAAQVIALENNQQLLQSPSTLLAELKKACDGFESGEGGNRFLPQ